MKIPTDIEIGWPGGVTEEWCQIVHNAFGRGTSDPGPRFSISLMTETWWTDPDGTRASAYLKGHQKRDEEGRLRRGLSGDFLGVIWTNKPDAMYSVDPNVGMVVTQNTIFLDTGEFVAGERGQDVLVALPHLILGRLLLSPYETK